MDSVQGLKVTLAGERWSLYKANAEVRHLLTDADMEGKECDISEEHFPASRAYEVTFLWVKGGGPNPVATDLQIKELVWDTMEDFVSVTIERFSLVVKGLGMAATRPQEYENWVAKRKVEQAERERLALAERERLDALAQKEEDEAGLSAEIAALQKQAVAS